MTNQTGVQVPEGIQRFNVGPCMDHPGFNEMHPAEDGNWIHVNDLPALLAHFKERLLSEELVEVLEAEIQRVQRMDNGPR